MDIQHIIQMIHELKMTGHEPQCIFIHPEEAVRLWTNRLAQNAVLTSPKMVQPPMPGNYGTLHGVPIHGSLNVKIGEVMFGFDFAHAIANPVVQPMVKP